MQKGSIEVICGSMFSGKTEELLRRLKRAEFAKMKIAVFKPKVDSRYDNKKVVSHDKNTIPSTPVKKAEDILPYVNKLRAMIANHILGPYSFNCLNIFGLYFAITLPNICPPSSG